MQGRPPLISLAELEEAGMWLGSELGVSFVCRCSWRSGIHPTPAEVRHLLAQHFADVHAPATAPLGPESL